MARATSVTAAKVSKNVGDNGIVTEPGIVVLAGPPCAGKSAVVRVLAADRSIRFRLCLEVDAVFNLLLPGSDRNRHDRMLAYDAAHVLACAFVERGHTVILECTYARQEQRASLIEAMTGIPTLPLWIVEFIVSADEAVHRFGDRDEVTDLDEASLRERVDSYPYWDEALSIASFTAESSVLANRIDTWLQEVPGSHDRAAWVDAGRGWG